MQVIFATTTEEGQNIPVIDVTNPAFSVALTDEELSKIAERTRKIVETAVKMRKNNVSGVHPSSRLSRDENNNYYTGMVTYFNKLGAENLHQLVRHRTRQKNGRHNCTNRDALAPSRHCSTFGR